MSETRLVSVQRERDNHYYTATIDGRSVAITERNGNGIIEGGEIFPGYEKYRAEAEKLISGFRHDLRGEQQSVVKLLAGVPPDSMGMVRAVTEKGKEIRAWDTNNDGKFDIWSFTSSKGVEVFINECVSLSCVSRPAAYYHK